MNVLSGYLNGLMFLTLAVMQARLLVLRDVNSVHIKNGTVKKTFKQILI